MSNYSKTTDFEAKDSLPTGDSGKIIRGAEFETEFDAISTAIATKADTAGPTFTGTLTFETISDGTIGVTAFVDEDDMSSDSATLVPTQQSVKAYVDSQVTAQDLDFQADSGGALSIDLDSETLTFTGGTGVDTSGSGNAVTFAIDSTVATLTGSQTLTNKTLTSPDVNTPDIDGGTIDGTVIGGATPAAVSATTVSATGNITVGGTVDGRDVATDGSKLDGIETGATADQTAAEIRTLVESASDSNVFTDADHSKLDGIEANADVTDTANVTAAGALMDSELTSIASVKALNQGVATTDSPTFAAVTVNGNVEFDGLSGTGSVTVTDILDQDDMSGNSATALATQQSIKAYVDSQVAGADTLAEVLANGNTTGGTDIAVGTGDDITFADSSKAIFGAGSDLQIYHDINDSYISDQGSGNLKLLTDEFRLRNAADSAHMITGSQGGAITAYHNGNPKLATTSTGIDVTGTVTADDITLSDTDTPTLTLTDTTNTVTNIVKANNSIGTVGTSTANDLYIQSNDTVRQRVRSNGDISFYNDSASSQAFYWDASTSRLGLGTTSPSTTLDVAGTVTADGLTVDASTAVVQASNAGGTTSFEISNTNGVSTANNKAALYLSATGAEANAARIESDFTGTVATNHAQDLKFYYVGSGSSPVLGQKIANNGDISFYNDAGNSQDFFWDASTSRLGLGTTSPSNTLHIKSSNPTIRLEDSDVSGTGIAQIQNTGSGNLRLISDPNNDASSSTIEFEVDGTERMRITSAGDVEIKSGGELITYRGDNARTGKLYTDNNAMTLLASHDPIKYWADDTGYHAFGFGSDTTTNEKMRITYQGNVGIGTSSPSGSGWDESATVLHVYENTTSGGLLALESSNTKAILNAGNDQLAIFTTTADPIRIGTSGSERMRIDSSGNAIFTKANGAYLQLKDSSAVRGAINVETSDGLVFTTGASFTERMRILSSGGITFNGDTATANALDDYEEGTWTPVVQGSGGGAYTYVGATARYTKIGNLVTVTCQLTNITVSGTGHSGYLQIAGLPFTKRADHMPAGSAAISSIDLSANMTYATSEFISASSTAILYVHEHGDNNAGSSLPVTAINSGTSDVILNIQYVVS